uniref:Uncharacterized protein n=1 Tax=Balaenoptera musculus TaxID=9771 RepID=A0A8C0D7J7_BALMU
PGVGRWAASPVSGLLVKEVAELVANLPCTCKVYFPDPNNSRCVQPGASQSEMLDQDLAPQHQRDRRNTSKFTERPFD